MPSRHTIGLRSAAVVAVALLLAVPLPRRARIDDSHARPFPPGAPRAVAAQPAPDPPIAYGYDATLGRTGVPWLRGNAHLNQPWGIGGDREGIWIANGAGRNAVRFGSGAIEELGRAGDLDALAGRPVRFLADVAVVAHEVVSPGRNYLPRRTVWMVDQGGHSAIGVPLDIVGNPGPPVVLGLADSPGGDAGHFRDPMGIAADDDTVFVSDTGNHRVQVFTAAGVYVTTIGQSGSAGASSGQLNHPARLALGPGGRLYIADAGNHRVVAYDVSDPRAPREVQSYGQVGTPGSGNDAFDSPLGVYADATFLVVADSGNRRVQVLCWRTGAHWRTLDGASAAGCGGIGRRWGLVSDVTQDIGGNVYVATPLDMRVEGCDASKWSPRGDLVHGLSGVPYATRDDLLNAPFGVAAAPDGTVAVVEGEGHRVTAHRHDGTVAWAAGRPGVAGAGDATAIRFDVPTAAAYLPDGRLVVADPGNHRLVVLDGLGRLDAVWAAGKLDVPTALAVLPDGSLAVADSATGRVRRVDASGGVTGDLAGPGGPLTFAEPSGVAVDATGAWYVAERAAHVVRAFDTSGRPLRTLGESGVPGDDFGHFDRPAGLTVDASGRLFVADTGNHRVQVFDARGTYVTTIGGRRGDGTGGFVEPRAVAVGVNGRVLVADTYNHRVQGFAVAGEPWRPESVNGFGARGAESIESLAELDGRLYAGVRDPSGAAILRRDGDGPWEPVVTHGLGDAANEAVVALTAHGNQLYAGIENLAEVVDPATGGSSETSAGGALWRSGDGSRWETVAAGGLGDGDQSAIGPLAPFNGQLYAGTRSIDRSSPPTLWRSASGDAGSWQRVRIDLATQSEWPKNGGVAAMAVYSGSLYVGTCAADQAQVWRSADGGVWRAAAQLEPGGDPRDALPQLGGGAPCVTGFASYDGHLYAALGTDARMGARLGVVAAVAPNSVGWRDRLSPPVELWRCVRCDGTDWEPAAAPGFGEEQLRGALALAAFDEPPFRYLYAFAGSVSVGMTAWRAMDGLDWEAVAPGGFGDDNNAGPGSAWAVRVYRNRLFVGTANSVNGGELWSSAGTRPEAVPTGPGPVATPTPVPRPSPQPPTGRARYRQTGAWPLVASSPSDRSGQSVDVALATDGTTFILDSAPSRVLRLQPDDTWGAAFGGLGNGPDRITQAGAIAVDDAAGRVYVSDRGTDRVLAFDRQGNFQRAVLLQADIVHIAVRPDGTLWLADVRAGAVRRVAPDGTEIERFGRYSPDGDDGIAGLVAVAEERGGRLWVADEAGARLRAYDRDPAGVRLLAQTLDMNVATLGGCSGQRLSVLRDGVLLAGRCILQDGNRIAVFPDDHRGSDLYGTVLHTALPGAGHYVALASYDVDRLDPTNAEAPAVVRYLDEGFDIVTGFAIGGTVRGTGAAAASQESLADPFRLDVLPGGDVVVMDIIARRADPPGYFRRFTPDGRQVEMFGVRSFPSRSHLLLMDADLTVATGEPGRTIGVAYQRNGSQAVEVVTLGHSIKRRYCSGGACSWALFVDPLWDTTLVNLNQGRGAPDYNYAAAYDPSRRRYWLLQVWADEPSDVAMPARLFRFDVDGRGRKTAIPLDGTEREAMWTDVDAGPDGRVAVLDVLNDRVQVLDGDGNRLGQFETPKDAWKVAAGPNGEVFVLTQYGHVVRMASDGTVLSRFVALPNDLAPPTALTDLGVDAWGRVYVIDDLYDQVTVFDPEGTEDDVLQGGRCTLGGDKWVAPDEVLLGDTAQLHMALFGTCGFVEDPADIVLMFNAQTERDPFNPSLFYEARRLRAARQVFSVIDLDWHRVGFGTYVLNGTIDQPLTQDRTRLIRALYDVPTSQTPCGSTNTESALRVARDMFKDSPPGRRKLLVLIHPDMERHPLALPPPPCKPTWTTATVRRLAEQLEADGITIVSVNGATAACSSATTCNIPVAPRGQGTGRRAIHIAITRQWPPNLARTGTLVDELPANMDYVPGSAVPPATWDAARRTLTWDVRDVVLGTSPRFSLTIRPRAEGYWPTNVRAAADVVDGWGQAQHVDLPVPRIRVYGERPPTPTFTPSVTPTPPPTRTPEPTPTSQPGTVYLPIALKTIPCQPDTQSADVALVIDTSGSMAEVTTPGGPSKLDAARDGARAFLAQLSAGRDQAAVIQFNAQATVVQPLSPDIAAASAALDRLTQATGTRIDAALEAGRGELTGPTRRAGNNGVLIVLTDGEPTGTTPEDVRAAADRAKAAGLLVFTIGLGEDVDAGLLRAIASRAEWYYPAPDTRDLAAIYGRIVYEIPCRPMWP